MVLKKIEENAVKTNSPVSSSNDDKEKHVVMKISWYSTAWSHARPYLAMVLLQFGYAAMSIITKLALNKGMSQHVLVVYRHAVATALIAPFAFIFDRNSRPKMTRGTLLKIALLGLLEPTIDQNLYYTGMKLTTATFATSMKNILPAFTFILALAFRLEKIKLKKAQSQAKIWGTVVTLAGAMVMTWFEGARLNLPWPQGYYQGSTNSIATTDHAAQDDPVKGGLMIAAGCLSWAAFIILQAITLKSYPAELSLTAMICMMGTLEGSILAVGLEWGNPSAWAIHMDIKLLAYVYTGVVCSGIGYYVQGMVMKRRGPVFVTAFNPLGMVIVTIAGSIFLSELLFMGRVIGAGMILVGLYMVLWGKSRDQQATGNGDGADHEQQFIIAVELSTL
ncbi:unnamed protein product [Linum trigynum]|uniref:WAT1-related protein n=1 Tax=Linum trigynum TaxID=586398 RepID=A0AAV2DN91_9ROSI